MYSEILYNIKYFHKIQYLQRNTPFNTQCYHSFGTDIYTKNDKKIFKFSCNGYNDNQKPCLLIGIIQNNKMELLQQNIKYNVIGNNKNHKLIVPYNLVSTMRAGVLTMGPLLGKYQKRNILY